MKVLDNAENAGKCICTGCPTYNSCMEKGGQVLYCARGKSECDIDSSGCICGECPVGSEYALSDLYYCEG